jgi:hypothetical protein
VEIDDMRIRRFAAVTVWVALLMTTTGTLASLVGQNPTGGHVESDTFAVTVSSGVGTVDRTGRVVTFPGFTAAASTFDSGSESFTVTNNGTRTGGSVLLSAADLRDVRSSSAAALRNQLFVRVNGSDPSGAPLYEGRWTDLEAHPVRLSGVIGPGQSARYSIRFFAGSGPGHAPAPSLTNATQGGAMTPVLSVMYAAVGRASDDQTR